MSKSLSRALLRSSSLIILISSSVLLAPSSFASDPLEVVVTADRSEVPLKNTGSAITVITSEEIEKFGSKNIADVLRTVPGLTIAETGSLGGEAKVSMRGASPGASMILLDGIRIGDPSNTEGYFDFGNFSAVNIERIEILRGPQSALYGSDAMGGVINIITKKGARTPVREMTVEGGSYGTIGARGSISGATEKVSYSFGVNALHSDGFARFGYRARNPLYYYTYDYTEDSDNPARIANPFPKLPKSDPVDKAGMNGRVTVKLDENISLDTGLSYFTNSLTIDNPYTIIPEYIYDRYNRSSVGILNGYVGINTVSDDSTFRNRLTVFGNSTDSLIQLRDSCGEISNDINETYNSFDCRLGYIGKRIGAEYQGDLNLSESGFLTWGARSETEFVNTSQDPITVTDGYSGTFDAIDLHQTTNSLYSQYRLPLSEQLDVSIGGRVDAIQNGQMFPTWRVTGAYRLNDNVTKIRASAGSGAKAPMLYQRYSEYGNPNLKPENSLGFDFGVDRSLLDNRLNVSATYFVISYKDKIQWDDTRCYFGAPPPPGGCYVNIGSVMSQGIEFSADLDLIPDALRSKFSYTFTDAENSDTDKQLLRVPRHQSTLSLIYSGFPKFEMEPRVTYVGDRADIDFLTYNDVTLPAYLKVDFLTRYKVNDANNTYVRFENLTDVHTEDAYNFGSAGRSVYVGWTSRW